MGFDHFGHIMPTYLHPKSECQNMPHSMWHRKSGEFLNSVAQEIDELRTSTTDQCKDLAQKAGNLGGLGSVLDILQSDEVQTSVAVMVQMMRGKMDKYVCCCARGTTFVAFALLRTPIVRVQVGGRAYTHREGTLYIQSRNSI